MKAYQIELKRTSYVNLTIEAENEDEAKDLAWDDLLNGEGDVDNGEWAIEATEIDTEADSV